MKRLCLLAVILFIVTASACVSPTATVTTTVTLAPDGSTVTPPPFTTPTPTSTPTFTTTPTYTLPTSPSTTVEPLVLPDSGYVRLTGYGYFKFQRVFEPLDEPALYEGVIFGPHREPPGVTSTGPIAYKIDVQFTDGTVEVLQYIGLGNTNTLDVNLTQHEHPNAGILLAWQDISGGLTRVMYLLVNVD
jgi:hypothetical protein